MTKQKLFIFNILLLLTINLYSQNRLIKNEVYQSLYSDVYNQPLMVKYKLYRGGGDCSRESFNFKSDSTKIIEDDYAKSGYDRGHMANSEDFAFNCKKDEMTFRYYNCCPQMTKLNRGVWKHWESIIRNESQTDSLIIICGPLFLSKIKEPIKVGSKVILPSHFYKVVYSLTTKKITHCILFNNKGLITNKDITLDYLKSIVDKQVKSKLNIIYK